MAFRSSKPLVLYYGHGRLHDLAGFRRAVLQPEHYSAAELDWLNRRRVTPLAYLSLGEDAGPSAPWHRPQSNAAWRTTYVHVGDPGWQRHLARQTDRALSKGFGGLFLDTLDTVDLFPEDRAALLATVATLRTRLGPRPLLANRGFGLLPELSGLVDGVVVEAFSTRWLPEGGCAALADDELEWTAVQAAALRALGVKAYALDYCCQEEGQEGSPDAREADRDGRARALTRFARARARRHSLVSLVSNRDLTRL